MREHWNNCITHFDDEVTEFVALYFAEEHRRCLLVAAAGFDPRSRRIAEMLSKTLGDRLSALFIREERGRPDANLIADADANEAALCGIIANSNVERVEVFGEDGAAIGGSRIAALLARMPATAPVVVLRRVRARDATVPSIHPGSAPTADDGSAWR